MRLKPILLVELIEAEEGSLAVLSEATTHLVEAFFLAELGLGEELVGIADQLFFGAHGRVDSRGEGDTSLLDLLGGKTTTSMSLGYVRMAW